MAVELHLLWLRQSQEAIEAQPIGAAEKAAAEKAAVEKAAAAEKAAAEKAAAEKTAAAERVGQAGKVEVERVGKQVEAPME
jgi:colicin import membrane protein